MKRFFAVSMLSSLTIALGGVCAANQSAVVGNPFRISESVKEYCEAGPKIAMCEQAMPRLAAMPAGPRNLMDPVGGVVVPEMNSGIGKAMLVSVWIWQKRR